MTRPRRKFPYYKVQYFDERSLAWKEMKAGFDTTDEAAKAASSSKHKKTRVLRVDADGYHEVGSHG